MTGRRLGLERFRAADDGGGQARVWLEAGQALAQQGESGAAYRLLQSAVEADPGCAEAWQQLAALAPDQQQRAAFLQRATALDPDRVRPQAGPSEEKRSWARLWVLTLVTFAAALALVAILIWGPVEDSLAWLLPTPTPTPTPVPTLTPRQIVAQFETPLQIALSAEDWDRALEIVDIMRGVDPGGDEVRRWAVATYVQYGQALVQSGEFDQAQAQFDQAVVWDAADGQARLWQQTTQIYRQGREALKAGQWDAAAGVLSSAYELMPQYGDLAARLEDAYRAWGQSALDGEDWTAAIEVLTEGHDRLPESVNLVDLLAVAYRARGIESQEQGLLEAARVDLEAALALRPDDEQARSHYDAVMYILFPPKRIEVNISTQRFYAWEGDTLLYSFPTSTGLYGQDTATGHYEVLDKIPAAYSSVWRLTMPYWLGVYYVGNIENGIHALPIRPDGSVMWGGLLGQRASYGCIILSTEAAQIIYNWAEIGTEVDIHY